MKPPAYVLLCASHEAHCLTRQGWGGRPVRQEQAQGILVAALGVLAADGKYGKAKQAS